MANGARGDETAAQHDLGRFTNDHAVEIDQIARRQVYDGELVLDGDFIGDRACAFADTNDGSGSQWFEGNNDIIARIKLQYGFSHVFVCGNGYFTAKNTGLKSRRIPVACTMIELSCEC